MRSGIHSDSGEHTLYFWIFLFDSNQVFFNTTTNILYCMIKMSGVGVLYCSCTCTVRGDLLVLACSKRKRTRE